MAFPQHDLLFFTIFSNLPLSNIKQLEDFWNRFFPLVNKHIRYKNSEGNEKTKRLIWQQTMLIPQSNYYVFAISRAGWSDVVDLQYWKFCLVPLSPGITQVKCMCVCVCVCVCVRVRVCVCVCVVCIESWNMYIWLMTTRLGPVQVRRSKYPLLFWVFIIINLRPLVLSLGRSVMLCQKGWFKVSCVLWAADPCLPDSSRWLCVGPPHNRRSPC